MSLARILVLGLLLTAAARAAGPQRTSGDSEIAELIGKTLPRR